MTIKDSLMQGGNGAQVLKSGTRVKKIVQVRTHPGTRKDSCFIHNPGTRR